MMKIDHVYILFSSQLVYATHQHSPIPSLVAATALQSASTCSNHSHLHSHTDGAALGANWSLVSCSRTVWLVSCRSRGSNHSPSNQRTEPQLPHWKTLKCSVNLRAAADTVVPFVHLYQGFSKHMPTWLNSIQVGLAARRRAGFHFRENMATCLKVWLSSLNNTWWDDGGCKIVSVDVKACYRLCVSLSCTLSILL